MSFNVSSIKMVICYTKGYPSVLSLNDSRCLTSLYNQRIVWCPGRKTGLRSRWLRAHESFFSWEQRPCYANALDNLCFLSVHPLPWKSRVWCSLLPNWWFIIKVMWLCRLFRFSPQTSLFSGHFFAPSRFFVTLTSYEYSDSLLFSR